MKDNLIASIGSQLNIPVTEDKEWICQTVYSLAGQMALASLWDHNDDNQSVSIQHFKKRIEQIIVAYKDIYPEIRFALPDDVSDLCQEMYSIYLRSGYLYHSAYQLSPCVPASAGYGDIMLYRGCSPDSKLFMSGLGMYSANKCVSDRSVANLFGLQDYSFQNYLEELLSSGGWESVEWPDSSEFLRLDPPFSGGYWKQNPDKDTRISLARYGEPNKLYVFCRYTNDAYQQKQIPEWLLQDYYHDGAAGFGEYRRIATALLYRYETLPAIKAKLESGLVEVKLGYRLPPSEETFFNLYSWPLLYNFSGSMTQAFTRKMTKSIYPLFKHELESIGYHFMEE